MRVYLGITLTELASAVAQGGFGPPPLLAYAVTPSLREWYAEGDQEELEYAATSDASRESLRHLSFDTNAPRRRVVVAADAPDGLVLPDASVGRSVVVVQAALPMDKVAAVHVDEPEAAQVVAAAADVVGKADAGEDDAEFTVDEALGHELLWYARQEIPDLFA
ncbi:DUF6912 family protein [Actinopolymorpha pittospori]|uniref:Uncharacterized protein n=1 Tax=Actinopolymorpha pittospori TaxID=648752 RepID=A0A927R9I5_9ACTN|nr:hypothetical protein [Actinopolymorpha pittospori]MBE1607862.1 hypothetical protein [Actinopolymorpha pittospori]